MKLARTIALAVEGRLYPSVILHGGSEATRLASAITFARALPSLIEIRPTRPPKK